MRFEKLPLSLFIGVLFLALGVIYFVSPLSKADELTFKTVNIQQLDPETPELISGKPNKLIIDSVGINIDVVDGYYNSANGDWTLSENKAHYALMTPEANNMAGNTFIYGHNNKAVFEKLVNIAPNENAQILTDNGKVFNYQLKEVKDVKPADVSLFEYQGPSILTVQTCTGTWYEKRTLYIFEFKEVVDPASEKVSAPELLNITTNLYQTRLDEFNL